MCCGVETIRPKPNSDVNSIFYPVIPMVCQGFEGVFAQHGQMVTNYFDSVVFQQVSDLYIPRAVSFIWEIGFQDEAATLPR
jgi:hypothetical protein